MTPVNQGFPRLSDLFAELEQAPHEGYGLTQRRIPSQSPCDLYAAVQSPANVRVLIARFHAAALPPEFELPAFQILDSDEKRIVEDNAERLIVTLRAPQTAFNDVFSSLAEDIARHVGQCPDETAAATVFRHRMIQWQRLLQREIWNGLTPEEQRGLYGELWLLREFLLDALPAVKAVAAWTGPEAASKDFQFEGGIAAEVKTTLSKQPQNLTISSERQLDDTGFACLYLVHLSIEAAHGAGETLPEIVGRLHLRISSDPAAQRLFEEKLLDVGYFDAHAARYRDMGYIEREAHICRIGAGFPRITERDLPSGVGGVRYVISAAACQPFAVPFTELTSRIGGNV